MKTLTLPKAIPESMFHLIDIAIRTLVGFWKPHVFCELGFQKLLRKAIGGFE
jgi:hypothetical protein